MMPRDPINRIGAALILTAFLLVGVPAGAQEPSAPVEVSLDSVGWWTSRPGATATEDGGFEVAADGGGDVQSVAAAQVTIGAATVDRFTVALTESSAVAEFGSIAVCGTVGAWTPENPGDLEHAPEPDCSTRVELTRSSDSGTWLGDITPLVRHGGTVSLSFLPQYRPPTPFGPGMVVRIAEIGTEATGRHDAGGPPTTTTTTTTTTPIAGTSSPASATSGTAPTRPPSTPAPVEGPPTSAATASPARPDADTPSTPSTPTETGPEGEADDFFTLGPVEQQAGETRPWGRLFLLMPLSAVVGVVSVRVRGFVAERAHRTGAV